MFSHTEILVPTDKTNNSMPPHFGKQTLTLLENTGVKITQCEIHKEGFWATIKTQFDQSKKRYIAICELGDYWSAEKILLQLRALRDYDAPLCLTAYQKYQYNTKEYLNDVFIRTPVKSFLYGCDNVIPSMWVMDKKKIKALPMPFTHTAVLPLNIAICMIICQWAKTIPVINLPLMLYQNYPQRYIQDKAALKQCHLATRDLLSPRFQYLYPQFPQCMQPNEGDRF
jgi:hypothetical protein